jgi:hypothetical protein
MALKMKALDRFEMAITVDQSMGRNIPEDWVQISIAVRISNSAFVDSFYRQFLRINYRYFGVSDYLESSAL